MSSCNDIAKNNITKRLRKWITGYNVNITRIIGSIEISNSD